MDVERVPITSESSHTLRLAPVPALLTTQEVAELLRVSPRTVRQMGACGRLERVKFGYRSVRYPSASVVAFIARADGGPADEPEGAA